VFSLILRIKIAVGQPRVQPPPDFIVDFECKTRWPDLDSARLVIIVMVIIQTCFFYPVNCFFNDVFSDSLYLVFDARIILLIFLDLLTQILVLLDSQSRTILGFIWASANRYSVRLVLIMHCRSVHLTLRLLQDLRTVSHFVIILHLNVRLLLPLLRFSWLICFLLPFRCLSRLLACFCLLLLRLHHCLTHTVIVP